MIDFNPEVKEELMRWCHQFKEFSTEPMSPATTEVFMNWAIIDKTRPIPSVPEDITRLFGYQVLDKRAAYLGLDLTPGLKVFLTYLTGGIPGTIVMYLTMLKWYTMQRPSKDGTCDTMTLASIFPMGFPSEESLSTLWRSQKKQMDVGDNMLDVAFV